MRRFLKSIVSRILIPLTSFYLRKERHYRYQKIRVTIYPGIFHPGIFHSTKFLLSYLSKFDLHGRSFLELGCGSGLISIWATEKKAIVTASDISTRAVQNTTANFSLNNSKPQGVIVVSDLFDKIPRQAFDWIVINPPYYQRNPTDEAGYAWNAGENLEYFERLFADLHNYMHTRSTALMVITMATAVKAILNIAERNGIKATLVATERRLLDGSDGIYQLSFKEKIISSPSSQD